MKKKFNNTDTAVQVAAIIEKRIILLFDTRRNFAKEVGISPASLQGYLSGLKYVSPKWADVFSEKLSLATNYLLYGMHPVNRLDGLVPADVLRRKSIRLNSFFLNNAPFSKEERIVLDVIADCVHNHAPCYVARIPIPFQCFEGKLEDYMIIPAALSLASKVIDARYTTLCEEDEMYLGRKANMGIAYTLEEMSKICFNSEQKNQVEQRSYLHFFNYISFGLDREYNGQIFRGYLEVVINERFLLIPENNIYAWVERLELKRERHHHRVGDSLDRKR